MKMINREDDVEAKTLNEFLDLHTLSSFKSSKRNNINVNNLSYMFYGCSSLTHSAWKCFFKNYLN